MNADHRSLETVFSIAICRQSGDKQQAKALFLAILDPRSSIVLTFSIASYLTCLFNIGLLNRLPKQPETRAARNNLVGRQTAIKNSVSNDLRSTFVDSIFFFDCSICEVFIEYRPTENIAKTIRSKGY